MGPEDIDKTTLAEVTAQIVSAYVTHHSTPVASVPQIISAVRDGLLGKGRGPEGAATVSPTPAVPVASSFGRDYIVCLMCGRRQKMLKRHIAIAHGLTPPVYRKTFGLRNDYPMTAPSYARRRSQLARQFGLGVRARSGKRN
jgi:predicted transcriptional regulator